MHVAAPSQEGAQLAAGEGRARRVSPLIAVQSPIHVTFAAQVHRNQKERKSPHLLRK
jgi:hypothetical protein